MGRKNGNSGGRQPRAPQAARYYRTAPDGPPPPSLPKGVEILTCGCRRYHGSPEHFCREHWLSLPPATRRSYIERRAS